MFSLNYGLIKKTVCSTYKYCIAFNFFSISAVSVSDESCTVSSMLFSGGESKQRDHQFYSKQQSRALWNQSIIWVYFRGFQFRKKKEKTFF